MSPLAYVVRLTRWFRGHPLAVTAVVACLLVDMAFNAFIPMAFRRLIDDAITPRNGTVLVHVLVALGLATIVATAAGMMSDYIYDVIGYNIVRFSVDWRLALLSQLLWPMVLA